MSTMREALIDAGFTTPQERAKRNSDAIKAMHVAAIKGQDR
jgi:hypothetical protein